MSVPPIRSDLANCRSLQARMNGHATLMLFRLVSAEPNQAKNRCLLASCTGNAFHRTTASRPQCLLSNQVRKQGQCSANCLERPGGLLSRNFEISGQGKTENVAAGGHGHVLPAMDRIAHRGSGDGLTGVEMPKRRAGPG